MCEHPTVIAEMLLRALGDSDEVHRQNLIACCSCAVFQCIAHNSMQSEQTVPEFPACSLAQAPHRQPWRKRGAIEVEDIVVLQPDCPAGGRCCRARLQSTGPRDQAPAPPRRALVEFVSDYQSSCR